MRNLFIVALGSIMVIAGFSAYADGANGSALKVLYVYDEVNDRGTEYNNFYRKAFTEYGIDYDEMTADKPMSSGFGAYDVVVIHGMVMAFNGKSPVRDWLKMCADLKGKKVSLMVTANRWFLKDLNRDLSGLLKKEDANVIDAVSMATKKMTPDEKYAAVREQVGKLK